MRARLALIGVALAISLAVACSDDGPTEPAPESSAVTSVGGAVLAVGPGLSVADAIASTLEGPLLVNGFVFAQDGEVRLCTSLPRAEYPTCGEPSIEVAGLDPTSIEGFEQLEGLGWSDESTQVLGVKVDGALTVSGTSLAQ